jgi:hypothetical protein
MLPAVNCGSSLTDSCAHIEIEQADDKNMSKTRYCRCFIYCSAFIDDTKIIIVFIFYPINNKVLLGLEQDFAIKFIIL